MARRRKRRKDDDFGFISNKSLRSDIKDALGFAAWLIGASGKKIKKEHRRELHRAVVMYIASVVEALCLYLMDTHGLKIKETRYKSPLQIKLPADVSVPAGKTLALVWCEQSTPALPKTPFSDSINSLSNGRVVKQSFAAKLHWLRNKRNTQHLYARESKVVSKKDVTKAIEILSMLFGYMER